MATLNLKGITKIYPHSGGQKKAKKGAPEKKTNLQVTDEGVIAVQSFDLDIKDNEFIVLVVWRRSARASCTSTVSS